MSNTKNEEGSRRDARPNTHSPPPAGKEGRDPERAQNELVPTPTLAWRPRCLGASVIYDHVDTVVSAGQGRRTWTVEGRKQGIRRGARDDRGAARDDGDDRADRTTGRLNHGRRRDVI